jgi:hypothetical protein
MRTFVFVAFLVVAAILVSRANRPFAAQPLKETVHEHWEYRTDLFEAGAFRATDLNAKGKQGWEFVQAIPYDKQPTILIFKRRLP